MSHIGLKQRNELVIGSKKYSNRVVEHTLEDLEKETIDQAKNGENKVD